MVDFPNPFAPPEVYPGDSSPQFRMPPFLSKRSFFVVALILLGAAALLIAFNVAGYAALTGSPEVLVWVPYFTLAATTAIFSKRSLRSFLLAVHSLLTISFWAYCYSVNFPQFFGVGAVLWLLPVPALLICVSILTLQSIHAVLGLIPIHKQGNEQSVQPELPSIVSH